MITSSPGMVGRTDHTERDEGTRDHVTPAASAAHPHQMDALGHRAMFVPAASGQFARLVVICN